MQPKFQDYENCMCMKLVVNFKIGKVNFKLLYFEYSFHYYKYYMLTNKIVCKDFSVPRSYICNLSPPANFPSSSNFSNCSSYPWSSLCISPISFISAFSYFDVLFFLEMIRTTIPAMSAIATTTMTAIIPAFRPCIENSGGFSST